MKGYGSISRPLTELIKRDAFQCTSKEKGAFEKLKEDMITALVLALPNMSETFMVETDASNTGIGVVIMQRGYPHCVHKQGIISTTTNSFGIRERTFVDLASDK